MDDSLTSIFIEEAEENLETLEHKIISLEKSPQNPEIINEAFRAIHSIKGGAGLAGFEIIKSFSHSAEDVFEQIRIGSITAASNVCTVLFRIIDTLRLMVENIKNERAADTDIRTNDVQHEMSLILNSVSIDNTSDNSEDKELIDTEIIYYIELAYNCEIFQYGIDPQIFLNDLRNAGNILDLELLTSEIRPGLTFDPELLHISWRLFYKSFLNEKQITDIFCFVIDDSRIKIKNITEAVKNGSNVFEYCVNDKYMNNDLANIHVDNEKTGNNLFTEKKHDSTSMQSNSYIRVPTIKIENLFNTVSELIISQARVNMLSDEHENNFSEELITIADTLKNLTQVLQDQVTSMRMISLNGTFSRFKRVVRDIAIDLGKKVRLEMYGQDTELDKNMIEKLDDPLKHIIRNCIDHGLETEEERRAVGKPSEGLLQLNAYIESGKVVIDITDDGRGIDKEKLVSKAIEKGLLVEGERPSDGEKLNLIFHPGLSTAKEVTDLSGRGVGMDAVKTAITELNGTVDIFSGKGEGTKFRLVLPLTLAILDGMLVSIGAEKYIIPTLSILEIFQPELWQIKTISTKGEVVFFRGDYIPLIRLHNILDICDAEHDPTNAEVIVVISNAIKAALLVDAVSDQYQVVLKSIQKNFRKINNISSATILGNGDVALVLDILSILEKKQ